MPNNSSLGTGGVYNGKCDLSRREEWLVVGIDADDNDDDGFVLSSVPSFSLLYMAAYLKV